MYLFGFQEGQHWAKHMGQSEVLLREHVVGEHIGNTPKPKTITQKPPSKDNLGFIIGFRVCYRGRPC